MDSGDPSHSSGCAFTLEWIDEDTTFFGFGYGSEQMVSHDLYVAANGREQRGEIAPSMKPKG